MNGRCETNPLDRAVDVCDSCYGEYCDDCLVRPKGRRHPVCTDCALIAAGVRGNAKPKLIGLKRTAKKRREALNAQPDDPSVLFQYFDSEDPLDQISTAEVPEVAKKGRSKRRKKKPVGVDASLDAESDNPVDEVENHQEANDSGSSIEPPGPLSEDVEAILETGESADGATAAGDKGTDEGEADDAPSTPAVAKLNELRKESSEAHDGTATNQAEPTPDDAATADAATADPDEPLEDGTIEAGEAEEEAAAQAQATDGDDSADNAAISDGRRTTDQTGSAQPTTAPMIGAVRTIGGRRSDDVEESQDPLPTKEPAVVGAGAEQSVGGRNGIEEFDAEQPATKPTSSDGSGANTDDSGNWIPPILRGMAADAREAGADLPHRRRQE